MLELKVDIFENFSKDEQVELLIEIVKVAGTTWTQDLLRNLSIPGRTKIIEGFRWGSSPQQNIKSAEEMLAHRTINEWLASYMVSFPVPSPFWYFWYKRNLKTIELKINIKFPDET